MPSPKLPRLALSLACAALAAPAAADPIAVLVENHSTLTRCAEEDNLNFLFRADQGLAGFKIAAFAPPYLDRAVTDFTEADFTDCPPATKPPPPTDYTPPPMVLYEDKHLLLRGIIDPNFWRPRQAKVRIDRVEWPFLDLVQLWKKTPAGPIEFLVFYPQDGYWRLKGLPPARFAEVSYGASFVLGPVEAADSRPRADYKRIDFDWKTVAFTIEFARGGKAEVRVTGLGDDSSAELAVRFDPPLAKGTPFAALRSMYVGPGNHDTEHVSVDAGTATPVMNYPGGPVHGIHFGRTETSRHNLSAPDLRLFDFVK